MQDAKQTTLVSVNSAKRRSGIGAAASGRRSRGSGVVAGLIVCAVAVCSRGATADHNSDAEPIVVRMYASAAVTADQVTLADVAELTGEAARLAGPWLLGPAPKPGQTAAVTLDRVQQVLTRQGANLAQWVFRGNTRCTVTRPTEPAASRTRSTPASQPSPYASAPRGPSGGEASETVLTADNLDPDTLGGVLQAHIRARLANLGGTPLISFPVHLQSVLRLSRPTYEFRIVDGGDHLLGLVPFEVTVTEKERSAQVVQMAAKVSLRMPVVVAARSINRGQTISPDDLRIEDRVFERVRDLGLTDTAPLVGQQAKQFVAGGAQLSPRDIEPVPLVRRNDLVTVVLRRGNLMIKASARAQTSGGYGDSVELKSEMAKRSTEAFTAVVTGLKQAEIGGNTPAPRAPVQLAEGGS